MLGQMSKGGRRKPEVKSEGSVAGGTGKEGSEGWKGQWGKLAGGRRRATTTEDIGGIKQVPHVHL